jgi:hypothetical protein
MALTVPFVIGMEIKNLSGKLELTDKRPSPLELLEIPVRPVPFSALIE